ncbi:hypothetical protein L195_g034838 [Trifolium pratense]|uniref:Uncharacterized protein n=1 Tax=Trifolium pratense TaxID=57577 RepID=A0A2K3LK05_TRIPR|nr:hypothetical protein L195_g034838 [Trifolium pratense]
MMKYPVPSDKRFGWRSRPVALSPAAQAEIQRLTQELQAQKEELNRRAQQDEERHQMMQQMMEEQRREMSALKEMLASSSRNAAIDELILMRAQLILITKTRAQIRILTRYNLQRRGVVLPVSTFGCVLCFVAWFPGC